MQVLDSILGKESHSSVHRGCLNKLRETLPTPAPIAGGQELLAAHRQHALDSWLLYLLTERVISLLHTSLSSLINWRYTNSTHLIGLFVRMNCYGSELLVNCYEC